MTSNLIQLAPVEFYEHGASKEHPSASVDIVAVHGLNEDMITAWADLESETLWLRDFLPKDIPVARVLTFGYDSSAASFYSAGCADTIQQHAHTLVASLQADRLLTGCDHRPIVFVCHGLGGVLVKKALSYSASRTSARVEHLYSIFVSTYGILFFGTPHSSIDIAQWVVLESIQNSEIHPHIRVDNQLESIPKKDAESLDTITDHFAPLMKQFHVCFFWEERRTFSGDWSGFIVNETSAAPILDNTERSGIDANHSRMVKFSNMNTSSYRNVIAALIRYCRDAPKIIPRRWKVAAAALARARSNEAFELVGLEFDTHHHRPSIDERAISPVLKKARNRFFFPPPTTAFDYIGRKELSETVRNFFFPSEASSVVNEQRIFVIHGMGGSGKTQFCSKFAKDCQDRYWAVFTIHAVSVDTAKESFAKIGKYGGLEETDSAGKYWLSQLEEPWLLIIDNADDPDLPLRELFPEGGRGHILVTTRNPDFRELGTPSTGGSAGNAKLGGLEEREALQLLLKKADVPRPWDAATEASGIEIARSLGYLALALIQAGTSIFRKICGLADYLHFHNEYRRQRRARIHSIGSKDNDVVYSAFDFSLNYLQGRSTLESKFAVEVLNIIGFYHFEHIRVDIFTRAVKNRHIIITNSTDGSISSRLKNAFWKRLEPPSILPRFLRENLLLMIEYHVNEVLHELASLSLISYDNDQNTTFSLHPLVHAWARDRLDQKEKALWAQIALNTLTAAIVLPPEESGEIHDQFRKDLLPHLDSCLANCRIEVDQYSGALGRFQISSAKIFRQTLLLIVRDQALNAGKCAYVYVNCGRFEKAALYFSIVKDALVQTRGYEDEKTMVVMLALAQTYWALGRLKEAIALQKIVVETRSKVFGPDHFQTLLAMDHLGRSYWLNGEYLEALELQQLTTERMKVVLGPDHDDTLTALDNLGVTLGSWHRFEESMQIHQQVLKFRKKQGGDTDLKTLDTMNNLAMALLDLGHLEQAKAIMQKVYEVRKVKLGKEHPWTLWALCNLSKVSVEQGLLKDAETSLSGGIMAGKRSLGEDHLGVLMGCGLLARVYARQRRFIEAEELLLDTIGRLDRHRGPTHPDSVYATWKLGQLYELQGKFELAAHACESALRKIDIKLTKKYPLVDKINSNLSLIMGQVNPAIKGKPESAYERPNNSGAHLRRQMVRSQRTW